MAIYQYVICGPGQSAGQDWEIQGHVKFGERNDTNQQCYHFLINPGPRVLLLF